MSGSERVERVYLSVGSNVERETHIAGGLRALHRRFGPLQVSTVYRCPAVGFEGEDFYNLAVAFDSGESIEAIHRALHEIEDQFGRDRSQPKFSPRTLDIDLLLYGDRRHRDGRLVLPRPEIERVAFVLAPLAELAPERRHPVTGESLQAMWAAFEGIGARELTPIDAAGLVPAEVFS